MTETKKPSKRRFPRARERFPVKLSIQEEGKEFEATVYTTDISLSGVFFAANFYLRPGTVMDLEFTMPNDDRVIRVRGVIVREVRMDDRRRQPGLVAGFAMRFVEYLADAKSVLASSFLTAGLDDFLDDYLDRRSARPKDERSGLREAIIAWEVGKMTITDGELDIMKDSISVDDEGRIHRRHSPVADTGVSTLVRPTDRPTPARRESPAKKPSNRPPSKR
jgi:hypothetical protein